MLFARVGPLTARTCWHAGAKLIAGSAYAKPAKIILEGAHFAAFRHQLPSPNRVGGLNQLHGILLATPSTLKQSDAMEIVHLAEPQPVPSQPPFRHCKQNGFLNDVLFSHNICDLLIHRLPTIAFDGSRQHHGV